MRMFNRFGWMPVIAVLLALLSAWAVAANTPCSGKKGGIDRCDGDLFLCNDGSISGSKKSCAAMYGNQGQSRPQTLLQSDDGCACGTGSFCTGPRGGVYCLTPSGNKSYKRK
ncbi:hypothetical protein DEU51_106121 [Pseudomonas jessenii]|uniref:Uncharacterized protein n=3 Tax=Pseudomonas TaxID=286 RepID=A0A370SLQ4_PSEJE|nr:hypothetical protein DEU51_106121 [Pseudomonas jessenii]